MTAANPKLKSDFLNVLAERGFIHQGTSLGELDRRAASETLTGYIGFDATARSLHAGSLIQIMLLYWLQQTGHRPVVLMGGGTTKIGDPSGKDQSRALLSDADIAANIVSIRGVFEKFLRFGAGGAVMADNDDWLAKLGYVEFLRECGVHFTINRMLTFDSVKLRLERESPMTFLEFNYMLMQAYDFLELYRRHGCLLQMGGSDQWGNIVNGVELIRRIEGVEAFGLTTPLLVASSGRKMGKTEGGAVWLNADMTSPYDYWQYWRNAEDADVATLLARFTVLPMPEVKRLAALQGAEINEAKKVLATEATALLHGRAAADAAQATAHKTFEEGATGEALLSVEYAAADIERGAVTLVDAAVAAGLAASKGEARRLAAQGGLRLNGSPVAATRALALGDFTRGVAKLSAGKKHHAAIRLAQS
jgi:tyrosyl-tRNA synthetase